MTELPSFRHNEDDDEDDTEGVVAAKLTAMAVLLVASMICGLLPLLLARKLKWLNVSNGTDLKSTNRVVMVLLAFGGGVLLSTTFMHLIPEVDHNINYLVAWNRMPDLDFSLAPLLTCIGFFIMFFVEECVHLYIHYREKRNVQNHALVRSMSIRRSHSRGNNITMSTTDLIDPEKPKHIPSVNNGHSHNHDHAHSHNHNHAHSHMPVATAGDDNFTSALRGLLIVLALSIHELFEGLAVGLESSTSNVWYMLAAVSAHKLVIAFCIGVELIAARTKTYLAIIYITTFAVVSPLGIGIGLLLVGGDGATGAGVYSVVLQGLASGTLMYVIFFEIWKGSRSGMLTWIAAVIGFAVMFGIQLATPHTHSHSHGPDDDGDDGDHGHTHAF